MMLRAIILILVMGSHPQDLAAAPTAKANTAEQQLQARTVVEDLHAHLIQAMKAGKGMSYHQRYALIEKAVARDFNIGLMSRLMSGPSWRQFSDDDRRKITSGFRRWTTAEYASQFTSHQGERFETVKTRMKGRLIYVDTRLKVPKEDPVLFIYRLRRSKDGQFRIVDILLNGAVSQLAMRRSEFSALVSEGGATALIAAMEKRVNALSSK